MAPLSKHSVLRIGALLSIATLGIFLVSSQWSYHMSSRLVASRPIIPTTRLMKPDEHHVQHSSLPAQNSSKLQETLQEIQQQQQLEQQQQLQQEQHPVSPDEELKDVRLRYSLLRELYKNPDSRFKAEQQLDSTYVPSIVHYVWCGDRWFLFKEYLSVMSVIREIRPDSIIMHYDKLPTMDKRIYHQWLDELKYEYPFLELKELDDNDKKICKIRDRSQKLQFLKRLLSEKGGIFVNFNTWILKFDPKQRNIDLEFAIEDDTVNGYIIQRALPENQLNSSFEKLLQDPSVTSKRSSCISSYHLKEREQDATCMILKDDKYGKDFYPMNIWELDDAFGRAARKIFYGTSEIRKPVPSYEELVPNIGHMIWLGGRAMDFVFYLSALSVLHVVKVDMLYIHGDVEPGGEYWPQLKKNERVKFIFRAEPNWVYQGEIPTWYKSLMSDIIRCDLMIKYGGIYTDTDAIWVKPLTDEERGYDAVASFDWIDWSYPYQDSVNMGLSYGKPNAPFWQVFRESMRVLHNSQPGFTGVQMPYKLLEKYPHLLRIDRHLSVICYKFRCHPTWVKDYHNIKNDHVTSNSIPNWREDVHAFHWTHPNPKEYANMTTLLSSSGLFADIGKHVLSKAGLLPESDNA